MGGASAHGQHNKGHKSGRYATKSTRNKYKVAGSKCKKGSGLHNPQKVKVFSVSPFSMLPANKSSQYIASANNRSGRNVLSDLSCMDIRTSETSTFFVCVKENFSVTHSSFFVGRH